MDFLFSRNMVDRNTISSLAPALYILLKRDTYICMYISMSTSFAVRYGQYSTNYVYVTLDRVDTAIGIHSFKARNNNWGGIHA